MKRYKGVLIGIAYGLVARAIFALEIGEYQVVNTDGMMTFSFIIFVPFVMGLIVAWCNDTVTSSRKVLGILLPLSAIAGMLLISFFSGTEGIICTLMALPIFAFMALLGGLIGTRTFHRRKEKLGFSVALLIPFLIAPIESYFGVSEKVFAEHTSIIIHSNEEYVWNNITRVKEITLQENHRSLFQALGFPRPIKAELDTISVGGVRKAIFDKGLFFTETVTEVVPNKNLTFTIEADPASIPPKALDEHVLVGGKYFDVLEGKYEIEKIDSASLRLHLTSRFRLSTSFNFYSGFWSRLIMRDIQQNILTIIKERSERTNLKP
jgi:hypothetical protein